MATIHFFTKLGDNDYLTEDGMKIKIMEIVMNDCLSWASSSIGFYNTPCDTINVGLVIKSTFDDRFGVHFLEVESVWKKRLSEIDVAFANNYFDPHRLCYEQTEMYLEELGEMSLGDEHCEGWESSYAQIDWQKEGF